MKDMEWDVQSYRDIGYFLGQKRESLGVSMDQAEEALRIQSKYIRAIEDGDFSQLPGKAYARGYVLSYAAALGISRAELDARISEFEENRAPREFYLPKVFTTERKPSFKLVQICAAVGLVLYFGWSALSKPEPMEWPMLAESDEPETMLNVTHPCVRDTAQEAYLPCYYAGLTPSAGFFGLTPVHSVLELSPLWEDIQEETDADEPTP